MAELYDKCVQSGQAFFNQAQQAKIREFDTHAPLPTTSPSRHRLTHAEAVDRAQLLAMFDQLDSRGQKTTLAMIAVAVKLHPKEK